MQWKLLFTCPCPLNNDISIVRILEWWQWSNSPLIHGPMTMVNSRVQGFLGSRVSRVYLGFNESAATAFFIGFSTLAE